MIEPIIIRYLNDFKCTYHSCGKQAVILITPSYDGLCEEHKKYLSKVLQDIQAQYKEPLEIKKRKVFYDTEIYEADIEDKDIL
jgi:hypothetical protein